MKKLIFYFLSAAISIAACKKSDNSEPDNSTGISNNLKVFVIDTNRIIIQNQDGTSPKTIVTVPQNSTKSVYIAAVSANSPVTKIAYLVRKGSSPSYSIELHLANADGSNDKTIKTINDNAAIPGVVKVGSGEIYYTYTTSAIVGTQLYAIKEDGTGEVKKSGTLQNISDISADGKMLHPFIAPEVRTIWCTLT